eukprot:GHVL01022860.1.p2 GENE.GHVL01022860.1~~GHVL01022860.1.p2  ORF type:complete len:105 (-),score=22.38 GHVL01022860.1:98-412(-)
MTDYESFQTEVDKETTYIASLSRSMSLALEEFYSVLRAVGVSSATGDGIIEFEAAVQEAREEFDRDFLPWLQERKDNILQKQQEYAKKNAMKFHKDINSTDEKQ